MQMILSPAELKDYLRNQIEYFFPDKYKFCGNDVDSALNLALERTEHCFKHISVGGYVKNGNAFFDHLYSDQNAVFLYYLSNSLHKLSQNTVLCNKLFGLNKSLNGICVMYNTEMPDIFYLGHTVGTVIGKATFGNYLAIVDNIHIGPTAIGEKYPIIGTGCAILVGARIYGGTIGDFSTVGANVVLHNRNMESNSKAYIHREHGAVTISDSKKPYAQHYFNVDIMDGTK